MSAYMMVANKKHHGSNGGKQVGSKESGVLYVLNTEPGPERDA